uniref:OCIA domain-containing protein n=1 Tax=Rhabditophanes sp. KR3021 TaxID=114890 RepID=A0AC35TGI5_9BILA
MDENLEFMTGQMTRKDQLSAEQIIFLKSRISSDDAEHLKETIGKCSGQMMMTRGLPFTGFVLGSLYFARSRLPKALHFGPSRFPFYMVMGIASLTASQYLWLPVCGERVKPLLLELYQKYSTEEGKVANRTSYDSIRQRNREAAGFKSESSDTVGGSNAAFNSQTDQNLPKPFNIFDGPSYMSGTPTSNQASTGKYNYDFPEPEQYSSPGPQKESYGKIDFS